MRVRSIRKSAFGCFGFLVPVYYDIFGKHTLLAEECDRCAWSAPAQRWGLMPRVACDQVLRNGLWFALFESDPKVMENDNATNKRARPFVPNKPRRSVFVFF